MPYNLQKIVFGGASLSGDGGGYGFGEIKDPQGLVEYALDKGIKFFDTAPIYGFELSEKRLGNYLKTKRDSVKLISKSGVTWHSSKRVNLTNDPSVTQQMLEQSLKNLRTDYIDIYFIHWPDPRVDIRFPLEVLTKAQEQGKILQLGLANTNAEDLTKAFEVARIEYVQNEFNLFNNGFLNSATDLTDFIQKRSFQTMGWGTFDKGILSGTVTENRSFDASDARSWAPWWKKSNWKEKVRRVQDLYASGIDVKRVALHYSLNNMDYSIIGAKSIAQLEDIAVLIESSVDMELIQQVQNVLQS